MNMVLYARQWSEIVGDYSLWGNYGTVGCCQRTEFIHARVNVGPELVFTMAKSGAVPHTFLV